MRRVRFDFTISVGNILTMLGGICFAVLIILSVATANAERDQKIASLNIRVIENEQVQKDIVIVQKDIIIVKQDVIRIQVNQDNHEKMLERIIDHLEK